MECLSNGFREGRWSLPFLFAYTLSHFNCVQVFATLWTVAHQPPLSMGFSRQEYWRGLPFLPPGDLPDPGMEPASLPSPALAGGFFTTSAVWEAQRGPWSSRFLVRQWQSQLENNRTTRWNELQCLTIMKLTYSALYCLCVIDRSKRALSLNHCYFGFSILHS